MTDIKTFRKIWNEQQKELLAILGDELRHKQALALFRRHHGVLHSAQAAGVDWSYEDEILDDLPEEKWRRIPPNGEHSIVWCIWHLARIEDATMNLLAAGQPQIFEEENWRSRLNVSICHSGNEMALADVVSLSEAIDLAALRAYRTAVGRRTQEIVSQLTFADLKQNVDQDRLRQIMAEGVLLPEAKGIADYWGRRTIAGLLLMPPTRHNMVHLNEAYALKQKKRELV